jgi:type II secretory pathway pseudopilin PulG
MEDQARDTPSTNLRISKAPVWMVRLGVELLVVFIGVYAAFALSRYEARRDATERRRQLQNALVHEIKDLTSNTRRVAQQLPVQLAQFDSAVRTGTRPPLQPWIEPVRVQTHMWEATLQSGALELFDIPTVHSLSQFYNELNAGFEQLAQLRALSESVLIPNLERGSSEFYQSDGKLRPKYQWYRDGLGRLSELAARITAFGDTLAAQLGSPDQDRPIPGR